MIKLSVLNIRVPQSIHIQMFAYRQGTKEGHSPCGLSITVRDLCVRCTYFCAYVHGEKGRKEGGR